MDLKVSTLQGIHIYEKDRITWGTEVKLFLSLQKKMAECLNCRQVIATPFANRSYQPRPNPTAMRRHNLVTLTRPNREKPSQPRKVNVGPLPKATQRNWVIILKAKEAEATIYSQASHLPSQQKHQLLSPLLHPYLLIQSTGQSALL